MRVLSRLTLWSALFSAIVFSATAAEAPTESAPVMIVNFTETVPGVYGYGTWDKAFAIAPNAGYRIQGTKGAQGDGGICQTLKGALDLTKATFAEIALSVQAGNEVPDYTLVFVDADGTQCSARIHVAQLMPGQPVWLRVKLTDFAVSTRTPGKDSKMDWSGVTQWHLQGDWSTKKTGQILFIALRSRS